MSRVKGHQERNVTVKANYILKQTSDPSFDHQIELAPFVFSYDNEKLCTKAKDGETTVIIYGRVTWTAGIRTSPRPASRRLC
ncbi:MAG: hypothetical protein U5K84_06500 [Alkalibacterium sp.]|nr:hypothetical protein [Alkalibacterium sp.]